MSPGSSKEREGQALARQNKVGRRPVPREPDHGVSSGAYLWQGWCVDLPTAAPPPMKPLPSPQNACIDIMEPLTIALGQREDVSFKYITGIPEATAFGMEWYGNETDPALNRPPLTLRDKPIPTQTFSPAAPQPNTGDFQDGIVSIQAPDIGNDPDGMERFYGKIIIYQD